MAQICLPGDPEITVELHRNARARRLSLRVSRLDGRVRLTLPRLARPGEAHDFARQNEAWIRQQLADCKAAVTPQIGGTVMIGGEEVPIIAGRGRSAVFDAGRILVPGNADRVSVRIAALLKVLARQQVGLACDRYARILGVNVSRITMRDTRSRWGSCSVEGNLMFSWRLIMAPCEVLEYVAAHEVAHLIEMNHSPDYWAVVARIYPDYKAPRRWLRRNGALLHSYQFSRLTCDAGRDHTEQC